MTVTIKNRPLTRIEIAFALLHALVDNVRDEDDPEFFAVCVTDFFDRWEANDGRLVNNLARLAAATDQEEQWTI